MEDPIAAIKQEAMYLRDSKEGEKDYLQGYVHASRTLSEFLAAQLERRIHEGDDIAVVRLFAFAAFQRRSHFSEASLLVAERSAEQDALAIGARLLRSGHDGADFLISVAAYSSQSGAVLLRACNVPDISGSAHMNYRNPAGRRASMA
jgi:hypothetical protein